jgi:hypothetical protein
LVASVLKMRFNSLVLPSAVRLIIIKVPRVKISPTLALNVVDQSINFYHTMKQFYDKHYLTRLSFLVEAFSLLGYWSQAKITSIVEFLWSQS